MAKEFFHFTTHLALQLQLCSPHQIFYMTFCEDNVYTALYFNKIQLSKYGKKQKEDFPITNKS